jgi:hypothetical protein
MLQVLDINTIKADDAIKSLIDREGGDHARFMKYKGLVRDVFDDLNLDVIRYTKRRLIQINKSTNSILLPDNYFHFASLSVPNACGKYEPMFINTSIQEDLVDINSDKNCECGSKLCGLVQGYESIVAEVIEQMPNNTTKTFDTITRKRINTDGSLVIERTFPVRIYTDGVWTGVELKTEIEELCKLDCKDGHVLDSTSNWAKCEKCSIASSWESECGGLICPSDCPNTFNGTEQGNRIYFPTSLDVDHVLMRYYATEKPKDIRIPRVCKEAFLAGLKHFATEFDDKAPLWKITNYRINYHNKKDETTRILNRYSVAQYYSVLTPKRTMP